MPIYIPDIPEPVRGEKLAWGGVGVEALSFAVSAIGNRLNQPMLLAAGNIGKLVGSLMILSGICQSIEAVDQHDAVEASQANIIPFPDKDRPPYQQISFHR